MQIGVIGAGQMGAGIAQVCAMAGLSTCLYDSRADAAQTAKSSITTILNKQVEKGKLDESAVREGLSRLTPVGALEQLSTCELLIEAIVENIEAKQALFRQLDQL